MSRTTTYLLAVTVLLTVATIAWAQTTSSTNSSMDNAMSAGDVTGNIQQTIEGFQTIAPDLRDIDRTRDTGERGTFVGADTSDTSDFMGGDQRTRVRTAQEQGGRLRTQGSTRPRQSRGPQFRVRLSVGFPYTPKISPTLSQTTCNCLARIPNFGSTSSIQVKVDKNVVTLEGTVATAHDRALALQMAALEPGVVKVVNRLQVRPTSPAAPAK